MGTKVAHLYDNEDLTIASNQVVDIFINTMHKEGIIDEDKVKEMSRYRVVLHKKGFFGKLFNKLFDKEKTKNTSYYTVVKIIPMEDTE